MKSGIYYEYFCPKCDWFPQMEINNKNEKRVKETMLQKIKEHQKRHISDTPLTHHLDKDKK